jgi:hypothetical protein
LERLLAEESDFLSPVEFLREEARDPAFKRPTVSDTRPINV